jgi:uncharacterized protein (DUF1499 family)
MEAFIGMCLTPLIEPKLYFQSTNPPMRTQLSIVYAVLLAGLLSLFLSIPPVFAYPLQSNAPTVATLPGVGHLFQGTAPSLGIQDGMLSPCPSSPNCVVSQQADQDHAIAPIPYTVSREDAREVLLKVLSVVPRTVVVDSTEDYIRIASESRLLGFVDDGEFYLPTDEQVIHMRSASRLGESDLGVNRRRLEQIRLALQDLGI